jgi:hypothetical protein
LGIAEEVMYKYGGLDGERLSELTHREDPWELTKERNGIIDKKCIGDFYFTLWGEDESLGSPRKSITDVDVLEALSAKNGEEYESPNELFRELSRSS